MVGTVSRHILAIEINRDDARAYILSLILKSCSLFFLIVNIFQVFLLILRWIFLTTDYRESS